MTPDAGSRTLLCIGETMAMVTSRAGDAVEDADDFRVEAGGAESNVAGHVAARGHHARWFSRLGDDALGRRVLRRVAERGVDVSAVRFDADHPTGLYVKDPGRGVVYYRRGSAASFLDAADADALSWEGVDLVHVSGITAALSASCARFLDRVMTRARAAGVPVSFDVNHRPALWSAADAGPVLRAAAARADVVFVGRDEAETLWRTGAVEEIRALLPAVPELVIKDADVRATAFVGAERVDAPALRVEVVEPVGAGDAFAGGYLAERLSGSPVRARLEAGHARAALVLRTTGDTVEDDAPTRGGAK